MEDIFSKALKMGQDASYEVVVNDVQVTMTYIQLGTLLMTQEKKIKKVEITLKDET